MCDAFDLNSASEITAIEAMLGFTASYPVSGTTPIDLSMRDDTLRARAAMDV